MCDAHDHLFFAGPRLPGQELQSVSAAHAELTAFRARGGDAVVQWTPYGLGRRAAELPALSRETGVHVVAATGLHQGVHYDEATLDGLRRRLAEVFVVEPTEGIGTSGVRAGSVKVAGGFHALDAHTRWTMTAAEAHHATGAPLAVHLELGTGALDVLDLLCGESGVPPDRVILGHLNRSPDTVAHRQVAEAGCRPAFDGPSRAHHAVDWRMPEAVRPRRGRVRRPAAAGRRHNDGGGPFGRRRPRMPCLLRRVRPRPALAVGEELAARLFTENPGRAFGVEWR